ncbi:MAG: hypothetical protein ABIH11_01790 [Candidatus Altiarchaeota archaeon]
MIHCKSNSSQVTVEFIAVMGILLMIFMMSSYVIYLKYVRTSDFKVYIDGLLAVTSIADNINTVNMVGDGYWMYFNIPARLYAFSDYNVSFFPDQPTVFVKGSAFARGKTLYFSAPISTMRVECFLRHCNGLCNVSVSERCIHVNESIDARVLRRQGRVYITERYNLMSRGLNVMVSPFIGSDDAYLASTSMAETHLVNGGSLMYVYEDTDSDQLDFVIRHKVDDVVKMDFHDIMGDLDSIYSDDVGEFSLNVEPEGVWNPTPGELDGVMFVFNSTGFRMCINPLEAPLGTDWVWINADGSKITLNTNDDVCITYP